MHLQAGDNWSAQSKRPLSMLRDAPRSPHTLCTPCYIPRPRAANPVTTPQRIQGGGAYHAGQQRAGRRSPAPPWAHAAWRLANKALRSKPQQGRAGLWDWGMRSSDGSGMGVGCMASYKATGLLQKMDTHATSPARHVNCWALRERPGAWRPQSC